MHRDANTINTNNLLSKNTLKDNHALRSLFCKCGCDRFKGEDRSICGDLD